MKSLCEHCSQIKEINAHSGLCWECELDLSYPEPNSYSIPTEIAPNQLLNPDDINQMINIPIKFIRIIF